MYTLQELKTNKSLVIFIENKFQWNDLNNTKLFNLASYNGDYCYDLFYGQYSSNSTKTNPGVFIDKTIVYFNEIDFSSVSMQEDSNAESIGTLPEYFYIKYTLAIINKLIELFPDSDVKSQFECHGESGDYPYIGVSEDFTDFEINNEDFWLDEYNCDELTEDEFWGCFQTTVILNFKTSIVTPFSKLTTKKTIKKLFKF